MHFSRLYSNPRIRKGPQHRRGPYKTNGFRRCYLFFFEVFFARLVGAFFLAAGFAFFFVAFFLAAILVSLVGRWVVSKSFKAGSAEAQRKHIVLQNSGNAKPVYHLPQKSFDKMKFHFTICGR